MNNYFNDIFDKIVLNEGGYSNDKDDTGGETYLGITRRDHPNAKMWIMIDKIKQTSGVKGIDDKLKGIQSIIDEARSIYKTQYWDPIHLDELNSKGLCYQIFDHAVNAGVGTAIKLAYQVFALPVSTKFSDELLNQFKQYGV